MPIMARGGDITPQGGAFIQNTREKAVTAFFYRVLLLSSKPIVSHLKYGARLLGPTPSREL